MTATELDVLKTAEDMRIWEELNKDDPKARVAVEFLRQAVLALGEAESYLMSAAESVEGTPEYDRIVALANSVEDIEVDVRAQKGRM